MRTKAREHGNPFRIVIVHRALRRNGNLRFLRFSTCGRGGERECPGGERECPWPPDPPRARRNPNNPNVQPRGRLRGDSGGGLGELGGGPGGAREGIPALSPPPPPPPKKNIFLSGGGWGSPAEPRGPPRRGLLCLLLVVCCCLSKTINILKVRVVAILGPGPPPRRVSGEVWGSSEGAPGELGRVWGSSGGARGTPRSDPETS